MYRTHLGLLIHFLIYLSIYLVSILKLLNAMYDTLYYLPNNVDNIIKTLKHNLSKLIF
jgi:hypothetical protein